MIDCIIYRGALITKNDSNYDIFDLYNQGKLPPIFRIFCGYYEYELLKDECIFAELKTVKIDYPEYFI